ncbi:MAG TPA: DUF4157 domain-containing protein, partial [Candidatus Binatia bacterium]|nr:DUF4157 domain-containing protein [Candidatus Binatia bacterium]
MSQKKQEQKRNDAKRAPSRERMRSAESSFAAEPLAGLLARMMANPRLLSPPDAARLQRSFGNRALAQMAGRQGLARQQLKTLQRQEEDELQAKPVVVGVEGGALDARTEQSIQEARGCGYPLSDGVRAPMEQAFGAEFGSVRVHTDARADALNRAVGARAFTTGRDVFFRAGEYSPRSRSGQELLAHELTHTIQQNGIRSLARYAVANHSEPGQIQRAQLGAVTGQGWGLNPKRGPNRKAKTDSNATLHGREVLKELDRMPDEDNPQEEWVHIEVLSRPKAPYKGYLRAANYQRWGEVPDHLIGNITKRTSLRQSANKKGAQVGMLRKGVVIQIVDADVVNGYIKVRVLDGEHHAKDGFIRADRHVTSNLSIQVKEAKWHQAKSKSIIGEEGANKPGSRLESAKTLVATVAERAQQLVDVLTTEGISTLDAFQRVAFILAGGEKSLEVAFRQATGGSELRAVINRTFAGKPGKYASHYLISMLDNKGEPSLKMQVAIPLGLIDDSGAVSAGLAKIPKLGSKIGSLGDGERILELLERAEPLERAAVVADPEYSKKIDAIDKKILQRIRRQIDVDRARRIVAAAGPAGAAKAKHALAIARDKQLGMMVTHRTKKLALPGPFKPRYAFDTKKFHDDLVQWKSEATPEDLLQIKRRNSAFQQAMKKAPTNWQLGLRGTERRFIIDFLDSVDSSGAAMQVKLVKGQLKRQAESVGRGQRGGRMKTRITASIAEKKWADIAKEIDQLKAKQREALLAEYDANDRDNALQMLEADLKRAGMNKEER